MKFSLSWLRTMVDPKLTTDELTHLLTMAGLEVEEVEPVALPFTGVAVGLVSHVERHPNADRLNVCRVDVGQAAPLQIVCGAPNVRQGMKVPCALIGAQLPGNFSISAVTMRGVDSAGMLCSAKELGLSQDHGGLLELPAESEIGADVRRVLDLDDQLITIKLTPNRADCLSVLGIAREVAALTSAELKVSATAPTSAVISDVFPVTISAPSACGRFSGRIIRNVNAAAATPEWMKRRLERAGQRSISILVDVTNYVMLELGRPLHVYDLAKLKGGIDVRFGAGESLQLLNEKVVHLESDVLGIFDESGAIGLAGIMGGESTKAETTTRDIFLEGAFFYPEAIAGRARRHNFVSDASHRFERGVDFNNSVDGIERATQLILGICGGLPGPVIDNVANLPARPPVSMRVERARKVIGVSIAVSEMADIFKRLGLPASFEGEGEVGKFTVTPPSYRFDLALEEDLIEEIARVYGFEQIPAHPPTAAAAMFNEPERRRSPHLIRQILADADYQEVINFSFVDAAWEADFCGNAAPIKLLNPIASHLSVMRSSLFGGLVENVRHNLNRKQTRVRVFEVGRVFLADASVAAGDLQVAGIRQPTRVAGIAYGPAMPEQWGEVGRKGRIVDFYDIKADVEALLAPRTAEFVAGEHPALHPGRSAKISLGGQDIGWIGELHPRCQQKYELPHAPVLFELDLDALRERPLPSYVEVSKFPPVRRDLAFVMGEHVAAETFRQALFQGAPSFVSDVQLFDVYRGAGLPEGQKSLAFLVVMQDTQRTLTDSEVDSAVAAMVAVGQEKFGATLRQ